MKNKGVKYHDVNGYHNDDFSAACAWLPSKIAEGLSS